MKIYIKFSIWKNTEFTQFQSFVRRTTSKQAIQRAGRQATAALLDNTNIERRIKIIETTERRVSKRRVCVFYTATVCIIIHIPYIYILYIYVLWYIYENDKGKLNSIQCQQNTRGQRMKRQGIIFPTQWPPFIFRLDAT